MEQPFPYLPKQLLQANVDQLFCVKLKWGPEYVGTFDAVDEFMNVSLRDASEYIMGSKKGAVGDIVIRCNNVLYMRELPNGYDAAE
ncbi:Small nuclear ribonucleoprotein SmF [Carpediemonas membranifera]|uniref:Sm protein F n=1 Tax=Carpediemonas membranifera TaxID=201153 RepID=A0A8J6AVN2_9EUKA|nr:Small nuclear ribonucleoprotein SmF [Carpediemonas membranifera]|eukprot:KAG9392730.1 Small nuclear ribonucleoprotein SmF [Carpediemonas membranifera]